MMMNTPKSPDQTGTSRSVAVTPDGKTDASNNEIVQPNDNDVLCGRGGSVNSHPGNERFRVLVEQRKRVYLTARFKREKRLIAEGIVSEIRALNPPGRFLAKESKASHWHDIGNDKARDKTSQALRENAPSIRAKIETEINRQRAEMQRAEEEEAARAAHGYHQQPSWGGYFSSYYGYGGAPPPPAAGGPHPSSSAPPAQGQHPYDHQGSYEGGWNQPNSPQHYQQQQQQHSEQSPKFGFDGWTTSVPSSFSAWTKNFSGGHSSAHDGEKSQHPSCASHPNTPPRYPSHHHQPYHPQHPPAATQPYYHENHGGGGDQPNGYSAPAPPVGGQPMPFSPVVTSGNKTPSRNNNNKEDDQQVMMDTTEEEHHAIQPQALEGDRQDSLLAQVANHILTSWDTTALCAHGSTELDDDDTSWWGKSPLAAATDDQQHHKPATTTPDLEATTDSKQGHDDDNDVELMDMTDDDDQAVVVDEEETRMPPPTNDNDKEMQSHWPSQATCQWIPDSLSSSVFFGSKESFEAPLSPVGSGGGQSTTNQDVCFGGGDLLCQGFKQQHHQDSNHSLVVGAEQPMNPQSSMDSSEFNVSMDHKVLSTIPSWENGLGSHDSLLASAEK